MLNNNIILTKDSIIRHICDNPSCVNSSHLIIGSHQDNVKDRIDRNRSAIGERNGRSKLTKIQVIEIRNTEVKNNTQLALKYGVDRKTIRLILQNKIWKE